MSSNFPTIFGGIVAYILLLLYAGLVAFMTYAVIDHGSSKYEFKPGLVNVVTIVGGLVSALVVAKLAITKPGENPALMKMDNATPRAESVQAWLVGAYLVVWLLAGLTALIVGVLIYPDSNQTLGEIGTTWLGLAVAAGYAYFGLTPK